MPARRLRWAPLVIAAALAMAAAGCASGPRLFVNREADMTYYKKIAVLPFANLCNDQYAGSRVTRALVTELSIAERYAIVDPAAFSGELDRIGATPDAQGNVDPAKLKEAAAKVEATGVLKGAVTEYSMQNAGGEQFPVVSFDAELIDAQTGNTVWRVSVTRKGKGRMPILGEGSRTFGRVTQDACQEVVASLRQKAF